MEYLRKLLLKALEMLDAGECDHITPEELAMLAEIIHRPVSVGREDAARFLGISLNKFHELRDSGDIPAPRKVKGQKEKLYYMSDLKKVKEKFQGIK